MRHRLPLVVRHPIEAVSPRGRSPLPGVIGVADTGTGEAAARFALSLAVAIRSGGGGAEVVLVAYERVPAIAGALAGAFEAAGVDPTCEAIDPASPAWSATETSAVRVLAGLPALTAFAPALTILLGAERPVAHWPRGLSALRGAFHLALHGERPGVARALAAALQERPFLLR